MCNIFYDFISIEYEYAITPYSGCSQETLISSQDDCKLAGAKLGYSFMKTVTNYDRPAGCYWYRGYFKNSFFNTNMNGSANNLPTSGGICKYIGKP